MNRTAEAVRRHHDQVRRSREQKNQEALRRKYWASQGKA